MEVKVGSDLIAKIKAESDAELYSDDVEARQKRAQLAAQRRAAAEDEREETKPAKALAQPNEVPVSSPSASVPQVESEAEQHSAPKLQQPPKAEPEDVVSRTLSIINKKRENESQEKKEIELESRESERVKARKELRINVDWRPAVLEKPALP